MKSISKLFLIGAFFMVGCSTAQKPDSEIMPDWISEPRLKNDDVISKSESKDFVNHFFGILEQVIFDPKFKSSEIASAKSEIAIKIDQSASISRGETLKFINSTLKSLKVSHLVALDPSKTQMIMEMTGGIQPADPKPAVTARMVGDIGIIKVETFLVPTITLSQVINAREKTSKAKIMIYDLRNNGGGSGSSASYVIENILGPEKTIKFSRTRQGIDITAPVIKYGYFGDVENKGSEAEIKFEEEQKYVEWKTRKESIKDNRKTYVLINSHSASSADVFAAAIKEHKAAKLVGTKTMGAVLGGIAFKLHWKGYSAIMPVNQIISPKGYLYEGQGVEPDYELKSCDGANDDCIDDVVKLIRTRKI